MRLASGSIAQMFVMAAIVTTALFIPLGALIALTALGLFGVSLQALVTFGGWLPAVPGLAAWWLIFFAPALVYSAYVMPWRADE